MWTTFKWMSDFVTDELFCIQFIFNYTKRLHLCWLISQILQTKHNGHTMNSQWPVVIFCQALECQEIFDLVVSIHSLWKGFCSAYFSTLPVEFTTSKISRKIVHIICQCKHTTLCQWLNKFLLRVEPGELVLCDNT